MALTAKDVDGSKAAILANFGIEVYEGDGVTSADLACFFTSRSKRGNPKNAVVIVTAVDSVHHFIVRPDQIDHLPNMEGGYDRVYVMLREAWGEWKEALAPELVLEHLELPTEA